MLSTVRSVVLTGRSMFVQFLVVSGCSYSFVALVVLMAVTGRRVEVPDRSPTLVSNLWTSPLGTGSRGLFP